MTDLSRAGTHKLGEFTVNRMGYGTMQLAGRGVFGPPRDRDEAVAVLRAAVEAGVNHIDTSDYYGPFITNEILQEALNPYPDDLVIVTKVGAKRGPKGEWLPAFAPADLTSAVHDNLRRLGLAVLDVVNLRSMHGEMGPGEGPLEEQLETLAGLQREGLVKHIGLSNVTRKQVEDAQSICEVACVQNMYNLAQRADDPLIDWLAGEGIPYVPFFPLGGFSPLQSDALTAIAGELGATPMQVALAWLLQRAPNILLIPGTSSRAHLAENLAAAELVLSPEVVARLDAVGAG